MDAGDTVLGEHLKAAARNAAYTSPVIQNQIIDVLEDQIRSEIIRRVQKAKWFTVIADEVTDVSNKEQLSLVLRYIDPDTCLVRENLVGSLNVIRAYLVKSWLAKSLPACKHTDWTCPICKVRHMKELETWLRGSVNGTAALIAAQYALALYIHCASHCLNLAVQKSLK